MQLSLEIKDAFAVDHIHRSREGLRQSLKFKTDMRIHRRRKQMDQTTVVEYDF